MLNLKRTVRRKLTLALTAMVLSSLICACKTDELPEESSPLETQIETETETETEEAQTADAKPASVETAYSIDKRLTGYGGFEFDFKIFLPQIVSDRPNAEKWNAEIYDKYLKKYGEYISLTENGENNNHMVNVSYEAVQTGTVTTVAIYDSWGLLETDGYGTIYDISHYNFDEDRFLSTDEFLEYYTDGEMTLSDVLTKMNELHFTTDENGNTFPITEDRFYGVIPHSNGRFDVCYIGYQIVGNFAARDFFSDYPIVTGWSEVKSCNAECTYKLSYIYGEYKILMTEIFDTEDGRMNTFIPDLTVNTDVVGTIEIKTLGESERLYLCLDESLKSYIPFDEITAADVYRGVCGGWMSYESAAKVYNHKIARNVMHMISEILDTYKKGANPLNLLPDPKSEYIPYPVSQFRTNIDWIETMSIISSSTVEQTDGVNAILLDVDLGEGWVMRLPMSFGQFGESFDAYFTGIYFIDNRSEEKKLVDEYVSGGDSVILPDGYSSSVDDFDTLGVTAGSYSEERLLDYVRAFLEGDTAVLEEMSGAEKGMYADYAKIKCGKYVLHMEHDPYDNPKLYFTVEILESPIERFSPGIHNFSVYEGIIGYGLYDTIYNKRPNEGAEGEVAKLLYSMYFRQIPTSDDMDDSYRWCLTEYICDALGGDSAHSIEEIDDFALTYFGIADFTPSLTHDNDGMYQSVPHGGIAQLGEIISSEDHGDYTDVTVQYYADINQSIISEVYVYRMTEINGRWAYIGCEKIRGSEYKTLVWSV